MTTWKADLVSPAFVALATVGGRDQSVHFILVIAVGFVHEGPGLSVGSRS